MPASLMRSYPYFIIVSMTGMAFIPFSVRVYSTLGGTAGYTVRVTSCSSSSSLNCVVSILSVIYGMSFFNSP